MLKVKEQIHRNKVQQMMNAMAFYAGDNPQEQSSTNEKGKDIIIEGMEGARHLQDLAKCEPLKILQLSEKIKNAKQFSSEACIFKVHEGLRKTNPEAYTPLTISIGPYHHGKSELRKMERLKVLYTQFFLSRRQGLTVKECWNKLKDLEGKAERYYGDDIQVSGNELVKMLLLDGCFIVEFVIRSREPPRHRVGQEDIFDPIFMISGMVSNILRDMLLLENQLPFFVLQVLYDMVNISNSNRFSEMVKMAFKDMLPKINIFSLFRTEVNTKEIKHLLQVVHILCRPQPQNNGQIQQQQQPCFSCCIRKQPQGDRGSDRRHRQRPCTCTCTCTCAGFFCKFGQQSQPSVVYNESFTIRTASELQEAGVDFKKVVGKSIGAPFGTDTCLFDIKFNRGILEIPSFILYGSIETFFRNLIAYEQHSRDKCPMYFTDYAKFMDDLINTEKDVNLLRLKGVFINRLGDDKEVTNLFNNLCKGITDSRDDFFCKGIMDFRVDDFYYRDVCKKLNRHCKKPWNAKMARLRRNYFYSPWAGISTLAAILLLSLAIAQTILTALGLHK